jgi:translation elongation factor EF-Tu-like GTPase
MGLTVGRSPANVLRASVTLDAQSGRRSPIFPRLGTYRPHLIPEGSDAMLGIQVVDGPESIAPGESGEIVFECVYDISYDELRPGVRFRIVEGPYKVGSGLVLG